GPRRDGARAAPRELDGHEGVPSMPRLPRPSEPHWRYACVTRRSPTLRFPEGASPILGGLGCAAREERCHGGRLVNAPRVAAASVQRSTDYGDTDQRSCSSSSSTPPS